MRSKLVFVFVPCIIYIENISGWKTLFLSKNKIKKEEKAQRKFLVKHEFDKKEKILGDSFFGNTKTFHH
jgi:hypothetical protein